VREADGRFVQTVKANIKAEPNVLARSEWEDEIASALPDLRAPTTGRRLPKVSSDKLQRLFATAVKRTTMRFEPSASLSIEAAIDRGEIRGFGNAELSDQRSSSN
jgi:inorganic triphosphatase YgiF